MLAALWERSMYRPNTVPTLPRRSTILWLSRTLTRAPRCISFGLTRRAPAHHRAPLKILRAGRAWGHPLLDAYLGVLWVVASKS